MHVYRKILLLTLGTCFLVGVTFALTTIVGDLVPRTYLGISGSLALIVVGILGIRAAFINPWVEFVFTGVVGCIAFAMGVAGMLMVTDPDTTALAQRGTVTYLCVAATLLVLVLLTYKSLPPRGVFRDNR